MSSFNAGTTIIATEDCDRTIMELFKLVTIKHPAIIIVLSLLGFSIGFEVEIRDARIPLCLNQNHASSDAEQPQSSASYMTGATSRSCKCAA